MSDSSYSRVLDILDNSPPRQDVHIIPHDIILIQEHPEEFGATITSAVNTILSNKHICGEPRGVINLLVSLMNKHQVRPLHVLFAIWVMLGCPEPWSREEFERDVFPKPFVDTFLPSSPHRDFTFRQYYASDETVGEFIYSLNPGHLISAIFGRLAYFLPDDFPSYDDAIHLIQLNLVNHSLAYNVASLCYLLLKVICSTITKTLYLGVKGIWNILAFLFNIPVKLIKIMAPAELDALKRLHLLNPFNASGVSDYLSSIASFVFQYLFDLRNLLVYPYLGYHLLPTIPFRVGLIPLVLFTDCFVVNTPLYIIKRVLGYPHESNFTMSTLCSHLVRAMVNSVQHAYYMLEDCFQAINLVNLFPPLVYAHLQRVNTLAAIMELSASHLIEIQQSDGELSHGGTHGNTHPQAPSDPGNGSTTDTDVDEDPAITKQEIAQQNAILEAKRKKAIARAKMLYNQLDMEAPSIHYALALGKRLVDKAVTAVTTSFRQAWSDYDRMVETTPLGRRGARGISNQAKHDDVAEVTLSVVDSATAASDTAASWLAKTWTMLKSFPTAVSSSVIRTLVYGFRFLTQSIYTIAHASLHLIVKLICTIPHAIWWTLKTCALAIYYILRSIARVLFSILKAVFDIVKLPFLIAFELFIAFPIRVVSSVYRFFTTNRSFARSVFSLIPHVSPRLRSFLKIFIYPLTLLCIAIHSFFNNTVYYLLTLPLSFIAKGLISILRWCLYLSTFVDPTIQRMIWGPIELCYAKIVSVMPIIGLLVPLPDVFGTYKQIRYEFDKMLYRIGPNNLFHPVSQMCVGIFNACTSNGTLLVRGMHRLSRLRRYIIRLLHIDFLFPYFSKLVSYLDFFSACVTTVTSTGVRIVRVSVRRMYRLLAGLAHAVSPTVSSLISEVFGFTANWNRLMYILKHYDVIDSLIPVTRIQSDATPSADFVDQYIPWVTNMPILRPLYWDHDRTYSLASYKPPPLKDINNTSFFTSSVQALASLPSFEAYIRQYLPYFAYFKPSTTLLEFLNHRKVATSHIYNPIMRELPAFWGDTLREPKAFIEGLMQCFNTRLVEMVIRAKHSTTVTDTPLTFAVTTFRTCLSCGITQSIQTDKTTVLSLPLFECSEFIPLKGMIELASAPVQVPDVECPTCIIISKIEHGHNLANLLRTTILNRYNKAYLAAQQQLPMDVTTGEQPEPVAFQNYSYGRSEPLNPYMDDRVYNVIFSNRYSFQQESYAQSLIRVLHETDKLQQQLLAIINPAYLSEFAKEQARQRAIAEEFYANNASKYRIPSSLLNFLTYTNPQIKALMASKYDNKMKTSRAVQPIGAPGARLPPAQVSIQDLTIFIIDVGPSGAVSGKVHFLDPSIVAFATGDLPFPEPKTNQHIRMNLNAKAGVIPSFVKEIVPATPYFDFYLSRIPRDIEPTIKDTKRVAVYEQQSLVSSLPQVFTFHFDRLTNPAGDPYVAFPLILDLSSLLVGLNNKARCRPTGLNTVNMNLYKHAKPAPPNPSEQNPAANLPSEAALARRLPYLLPPKLTPQMDDYNTAIYALMAVITHFPDPEGQTAGHFMSYRRVLPSIKIDSIGRHRVYDSSVTEVAQYKTKYFKTTKSVQVVEVPAINQPSDRTPAGTMEYNALLSLLKKSVGIREAFMFDPATGRKYSTMERIEIVEKQYLSKSSWYLCNDDAISLSTEKSVLSAKPFMLFYERI